MSDKTFKKLTSILLAFVILVALPGINAKADTVHSWYTGNERFTYSPNSGLGYDFNSYVYLYYTSNTSSSINVYRISQWVENHMYRNRWYS